MDNSVFDLTEKQKGLLKKLKKAYSDCLKAKMLPVNIYGSLTFYNRQYVHNYGDNNSGFIKDKSIELNGDSRTINSFKIPNEWSDDPHIIELTEKGMNKYLKDNE